MIQLLEKQPHAQGPCCNLYALANRTQGKNGIGIVFQDEYEGALFTISQSDMNNINLHSLSKKHKRWKMSSEEDINWLSAILSHETLHLIMNRMYLIRESYALDVLHDHEANLGYGQYTREGLAWGTIRKLEG